MRDFIHLDTIPAGEKCAQFGTYYGDKHWNHHSRIEAGVMIDMIQRLFPPKGSVSFRIASNEHDLGQCGSDSYLYIRVSYNDDNESEEDYVFELECKFEEWDQPALQLLQEKRYAFEEILGEDRLYRSPLLKTV